jgi:hypothetical protein
VRNGRAELYAPMSPGLRQFVLTYMLPVDEFPASFPVGRETGVLEVLVEEPRAEVEGAGLREGDPAPIEGRTFRRFLAQDAPRTAVVRVDAPSPSGQNREAQRVLLVVVGVAMLVALGVWYRRGRGRPARARVRGDRRAGAADDLIARIAALDARYEQAGGDRAVYEAERAALKQQLERVLAGGGATP